MIYDDILGTIGNTRSYGSTGWRPGQHHLRKDRVLQPGGSVKDRLAIAMIDDAERRGVLRPGMTVVEPTSGNTGIALAMVCAARGYRFVAVMSESFSVERRRLMKALGAKVLVTKRELKATGMVAIARELPRKTAGFCPSSSRIRPIPSTTATPPGPEICATSRGAGWMCS